MRELSEESHLFLIATIPIVPEAFIFEPKELLSSTSIVSWSEHQQFAVPVLCWILIILTFYVEDAEDSPRPIVPLTCQTLNPPRRSGLSQFFEPSRASGPALAFQPRNPSRTCVAPAPILPHELRTLKS